MVFPDEEHTPYSLWTRTIETLHIIQDIKIHKIEFEMIFQQAYQGK